MIATTTAHRALVTWDQALRRPLPTPRRIAVAALRPGSGTTTTTAELTAALARRRPGPADVLVTDLGVRPVHDLAPETPSSHVVCLVSRLDVTAATEAIDLATAYAGPLVLVLVEVEPVGAVLRWRVRRASPVPTMVIRHEPALRLAEAHRPRRMPYAYRVAHLALAAALMEVGA